MSDRIILFDGVCKLCSAWAKFLIKYDRNHTFALATVQSAAGQRLLALHGLPTDTYSTMALIDDNTLYTQSSAFLQVMRLLPLPWPLFTIFYIIPRPIRDWLYDRIALNRYKLFGKFDSCLLPTPDHQKRFIDGD